MSAILILGSLAALAVRGLNFGIDFTGGVVLEFAFPQAADLEQVRGALARPGIERRVGAELRHGERRAGAAAAGGGPGHEQARAERARRPSRPTSRRVELRRTEVVGPQVGEELAEKGALAVLFTFLLIMAYVAFRFQWKLGDRCHRRPRCTTRSSSSGFFAITGLTFDLPALAAILAVIGYSLNDTVVVFDRIRERFLSTAQGHARSRSSTWRSTRPCRAPS